MLNEADNTRRFKNLISTAQLVKKMVQHGYSGNFTEQAIYVLFDKCGIKPKTRRGGKAYFNKKNACDCIDRHIFDLRNIADNLEANSKERQSEDEIDNSNMNYGRSDMGVASRELLANDGVFGADENELYNTNENKKIVRISEDKLNLFEINFKKNIKLSEGQFKRLFVNEDVFANKKVGKNKLQLTYDKRTSNGHTKNKGQLNPQELLNTGKMDQNNSDTFIVPLKGGIDSYNITSIRGTEIMHYFKNKFAKMNLDLDGDGVKESYELMMQDSEYRDFINQFCEKVNNVVTYAIRKMGVVENFRGVSIYPVPSSSNFNVTMVKQLAGKVKFANLPTIAIDSSLFNKDMESIKADDDFMRKNSSYFDSKMLTNGSNNQTHRDFVNNTVSKINQIGKIKKLIDQYNYTFDRLYRCYAINRKKYGDRFPEALAKFYKELSDILAEIDNCLYYSGGKMHKTFEKLKGTKTPSEIRNTENIWKIVKPFFRGTGQKPIPMHRLQQDDFQIKNLSNDIRMGMMDYFSPNMDYVNKEIEKIKATVFVIFDDNISGGATLSDICYNAKKLGIRYIIPITFGEMDSKYNLGPGVMVNKPNPDGRFTNY